MLKERVSADARILVLGAGGGLELIRLARLTRTGMLASQASINIPLRKEGLPRLITDLDVELLKKAGFFGIELFYSAFTFKGWVAHK